MLHPLPEVPLGPRLVQVFWAGNDLKPMLTSQQRDDLNELWIPAGAGIDVVIGHFYIRPMVLAGFKPLSTTDKNVIDTSGYADVSMWYLSIEGGLLVGNRF
jgi:hypothetical protein